MADKSIEDNILLNYEGFLIEQAIFFDEVKEIVDDRINTYKNNYKAYYSHDLDEQNKLAYDKALEEIEKIKRDLSKMSELLDIFGLLTQNMVDEDIEILEILKIQNKELKEALHKTQNVESSSKPLKENYKQEYRTNFLMLFTRFIFAIIILVIAYIQIKNRKI